MALPWQPWQGEGVVALPWQGEGVVTLPWQGEGVAFPQEEGVGVLQEEGVAVELVQTQRELVVRTGVEVGEGLQQQSGLHGLHGWNQCV